MGLKFRIFIKAEHYTMSSPAAFLRKVATASAASSAAPQAAHVAPPSTSRSTHRVAGGGGAAPAPAPAPAAGHPPAAAHPAPDPKRECKAFNGGKHCTHGMGCYDNRCKAKTAAAKAAASSSKPSQKAGPGDGGVAQRLAQMEKSIADVASRVDAVGASVQQGFQEQSTRAAQFMEQSANVHLQTMQILQGLGAALAGGISAIRGDFSSRPELPAPPALPAICAPSSVRSTVTEVYEEKFSARGGGCSSEVCKSGWLTGAHIDPFMHICVVNQFPQKGILFRILCELCDKTGLTDYHRCLISSIGKATNIDNLAALLFLLLTGSKQFRKSSFNDFRTACDAMLGSNLTKTQSTFSNVCVLMINSMPNWQISKKGGINVSNADLKDNTKHASAFDTLVKNFQS
jgi:hypothetical protein